MNCKNSGIVKGTSGSGQMTVENTEARFKAEENETKKFSNGVYAPSAKHNPGSNWGSENPIKSHEEGQDLLDTGYREGKQIYNITQKGKFVKFQPDNTQSEGYHSYEVFSPPDIPPSVLKKMFDDGRISKSDYKKALKGKTR